jgi:hypothetical protein
MPAAHKEVRFMTDDYWIIIGPGAEVIRAVLTLSTISPGRSRRTA